MIEEFEGSVSSAVVHGHHAGFQNAFATDVLHLVASFEELGKPFSVEGEELMTIHSKEIMDSTVVNTVRNARKIGEKQFLVKPKMAIWRSSSNSRISLGHPR